MFSIIKIRKKAKILRWPIVGRIRFASINYFNRQKYLHIYFPNIWKKIITQMFPNFYEKNDRTGINNFLFQKPNIKMYKDNFMTIFEKSGIQNI